MGWGLVWIGVLGRTEDWYGLELLGEGGYGIGMCTIHWNRFGVQRLLGWWDGVWENGDMASFRLLSDMTEIIPLPHQMRLDE